MSRFPTILAGTLLFISVLLFAPLANANDSAVEVTPTGLQFKEVRDIVIEREDLRIGKQRVDVTYVFRNTGTQDLTTEVAFPIPPYEFRIAPPGGIPSFDDFTVEVNGTPVLYRKDIRAQARGKDVTDLLTARKISIKDFDGLPDTEEQFTAKIGADMEKFRETGVIGGDGWPDWQVAITCHWTQTFPAGTRVTIHHRYTPYTGFRAFRNEDEDDIPVRACLDQDAETWLNRTIPPGKEVFGSAIWLGYILTTANNWRRPIGEFHLTIDKAPEELVSACFDRPLKTTGPTRAEIHLRNYQPTQDLQVFFLGKM
ncbi:DUF4424 family protein [Geobacter sp. AOG1]|uniref:DUF4424 family protein n=1 Tax=Geobacter sp. AOG1 TaxID=1566346 RepID=UPI001CC72D10|nr:DUF4424 family protein [Geobacter sp. AOG1]GFE57624.1 hypothetical protein AOG1_15040 [Geobacter sp. AOG1]